MRSAPARATSAGRNRDAPAGPLYCVELDQWLPLDLSIPQAAMLIGRSERSVYRSVKAELADIAVGVAGGDLRLATAPLMRRYGLHIGRPDGGSE